VPECPVLDRGRASEPAKLNCGSGELPAQALPRPGRRGVATRALLLWSLKKQKPGSGQERKRDLDGVVAGRRSREHDRRACSDDYYNPRRSGGGACMRRPSASRHSRRQHIHDQPRGPRPRRSGRADEPRPASPRPLFWTLGCARPILDLSHFLGVTGTDAVGGWPRVCTGDHPSSRRGCRAVAGAGATRGTCSARTTPTLHSVTGGRAVRGSRRGWAVLLRHGCTGATDYLRRWNDLGLEQSRARTAPARCRGRPSTLGDSQRPATLRRYQEMVGAAPARAPRCDLRRAGARHSVQDGAGVLAVKTRDGGCWYATRGALRASSPLARTDPDFNSPPHPG